MIGDRKKDLLCAKGADVKFYYKSKKKNLYQQVKELVKKKQLFYKFIEYQIKQAF